MVRVVRVGQDAEGLLERVRGKLSTHLWFRDRVAQSSLADEGTQQLLDARYVKLP